MFSCSCAGAQVHEHCWTVVRWAILAIGSGDSAARMLRFYSRLLEHFMGVDPRSPEEVQLLRRWWHVDFAAINCRLSSFENPSTAH